MNYWLVGAKWGGEEETLDTFIEKGYWYCWDPKYHIPNPDAFSGGNSVARQQNSFKEIKKGDRIAVKRLQGPGSRMIDILAIGIAKTDADESEWRVYVDWIAISPVLLKLENFKNLTNLPKIVFSEHREIEIGDCRASIHGPYSLEKNKEWLPNVFFI
ncbi:TPA: glycyl-tRNA synthetase subunit alpha [Pasteurella multocida]|nr:glycyl-tRNA synthetase subunit alpha [Pasteurella multocida]HDR1933733.1 glycyl-tRNA synthetase subunit alpha [Pasteurella multocida]